MNQIRAKIIEVNKQTEDISEFILELENKINFIEGQFITINIENGDKKILKRAYSVVNYNQNLNKLTLLIKNVNGIGTKWIFSKNIGEYFNISGAFGHLTLQNKEENQVFFATGIGLPPIICLIRKAIKESKSKKIKLFFGSQTVGDIYYEKFFKELEKNNPNFSYNISLSREEEKNYHKGYITNHPDLEQIDFTKSDTYYCGNIPAMKSLKEKLTKLGLNKKNFYQEAY